ncbi:hypothetical protein JX266_000077 [Neoarthrinium moseri]|nr:hypothetical protein JX266_000077 [Neoarthrinium moseri]
MATEQPQSTPADLKVGGVAPEKDKMAVDEPAAETVNGHNLSDDAPITNGKSPSPDPALNQQAFAANGALSAQSSPPKPATEDTEMADVNGVKEPESNVEQKSEQAKDASEVQAPASPPKSATPKPPAVDESMEIDTSTDRPDVSSSAEHAESTQDTSALGDSAVVASPQELSQPADISSKLDGQSPPVESQPDVPMSDRAASPTKVSRERDDDATEEPSAKRTKLESEHDAKSEAQAEKAGDSIGVASGLSPAPAGSVNEHADDVPDDQVVNSFQSREVRKELARVKKTKNGMNFRASVEKLWPAIWENYKAVIINPVDLSLFEAKFRDGKYTTFGEFKADLELLYNNSMKFNGPENVVTVAASRVRSDLLGKLSEISKLQEPAKLEKGKAQPTRHTEPRAATHPRRPSESQPRVTASSPKPKPEVVAAASVTSTPVTSSAPAFALPPNGVPQIRRDSTRDDGNRPKRPIKAPPNRDPDYSQNARKKKLEPEMKFYAEILTEIKKPKYWAQNQWFMEPVDPVALNIPTYFSVVKKPMDLKTITDKLDSGEYRNGKEIEKDVKQIVLNSELFNGEGAVTAQARDLENVFKEKLADKETWMARNYPPQARSVTTSVHSPEASDQESDVETDAEADANSESIRNVTSRLTEEQEKLNNMIFGAKSPDKTMVEIQQNVVNMLQLKLVDEKCKAGTTKKAKPSKKASAKAKSKPSTSTGGASSKKGASGAAAPSSKNRPATNKKSSSKKKTIGQLEKTVITDGISELDGPTLDKAVDIIKKDTHQKEDDDGQLELDIEVLSQDALLKLFELINRAYPNIYEGVARRPEYSNRTEPTEHTSKSSGIAKPKKNKPMNKHEQERNIEKLRELKAQFQRQGSGSQEPVPEEDEQRAGNSSEEESDSEEE